VEDAGRGREIPLRGYVAVFLQHPGSDSSVWRDVPPRQRRSAMEQAAGSRNFLLRVKDVKAVLDQLARWNEEAGHSLSGRLDLRHVGMSGHSFADPRIKAAIAMSPSRPRRGGDAAEAFGDVAIPWLLMTGTKDVAPIGGADVESRLAVFPALPPGGKYEVVLDGAEHSAFSDRALPGDTAPRNPNHHRVILALSTAFWDAWLWEDPAARHWLDGDGPRSVLERGDRWQRK
jgi:predicted dienelactone hydrolase